MLFPRKGNINFNVIFRILGLLLLIESGFMLIPLAVCYFYSEFDEAVSFWLSIAVTAGCGLLLMALTKSRDNDMGKREGILLTALVWVLFSLFGMLPFVFGSANLDVASAYFETMSGFTTTGVSAIASVEDVSHGILMWRAITHFVGGMGIILFTLAVIPMLNKKSGIQLFNAEVTGITHDKVRPRISHTAKSLWGIYFLLNTILIVLLWMGPMNLFDSVCHAFSAIATGGFSTKNASIEAYNSDYVKIVLSIFMFLSGANFGLLYYVVIGRPKALFRNDTFRWYAYIVVGAVVIIAVRLWLTGNYPDLQSLVIDTVFQVVTTITTTGFVGSDYLDWQGLAIIVILAIMVVGSCAGSTAGGFKIDRLVVSVRHFRNELYKIIHPNTVKTVRVNGKVLQPELVSKTNTFLLVYVVLIFIGTAILAETGVSFFDSLFMSVSTLSNIGLGYGVSGSSFAAISDVGKWTMSVLMLLGRLELFTVLIIFTKHFWNKK